jgi:hypothetical protein
MPSSHVKCLNDHVLLLRALRGEQRVTGQFRLFLLLLSDGAEVVLLRKQSLSHLWRTKTSMGIMHALSSKVKGPR